MCLKNVKRKINEIKISGYINNYELGINVNKKHVPEEKLKYQGVWIFRN